jgi:hypothetical protein
LRKKYLFKATIPEVLASLQLALDLLNTSLARPSSHQAEIAKALNLLIVDVKNIRRKARGDSLRAAKQLMQSIDATKPRRYYFWRDPTFPVLDKPQLLDIWGKGLGLIHSIEQDLNDYGWSGK